MRQSTVHDLHIEMKSISRHFASIATLIFAVGGAQATPLVRTGSISAAENAVLSLKSSLLISPRQTENAFDFELGISDHKKQPSIEVPASQRIQQSGSIHWDRG